MKKILILTQLIPALFLLQSCTQKQVEIKWSYSNTDVIETANTLMPDSVEIYLFLDATTSMKGFVSNPTSVYNTLLDEFERSAQAGWKTVKIRFFKFGTRFKEIDRNQFRQAKTQKFYEEPGIYEKTNIDSVVKFIGSNYATSQLYVIITDLFQSEADINIVTASIKESCFSKGISIGILGVKSDFEGMVFDAKVPPYYFKSKIGDLSTYRNLFLLIFGSTSEIKHLIESLSSASYVDKSYFILISNKIVQNFTTNMTKVKTETGVSPKSVKRELNLYNFNVKDKTTLIQLQAEIQFRMLPYSPQVNLSGINIIAYRKIATSKDIPKDSTLSSDVFLKNVEGQNDYFKAIIEINLPEPKVTYSSYLIYFYPSINNGFILPDWITEFSSDNPNPKKDQNKTLNFDRFVYDLMRANSAVNQPKIAKVYLNFNRI